MRRHSDITYERHLRQTVATRQELHERWANRVLLGEVKVIDLLQLLHFTVDHTDTELLYTSQLIHSLQVYEMVTSYDLPSPDLQYKNDLQIAALVHDLGKLLSLFGEADRNVDCMNTVIDYDDPGGASAQGLGIGHLAIQWNHDEYAYQKLRHSKLPPRVLAAVRFHSLREMTGKSFGPRRFGSEEVVITEDDMNRFSKHFSAEDVESHDFVDTLRWFDMNSKQRVDDIPDVSFADIEMIVGKYFANGQIIW
ncbi:unnamed protein product [Polarella glacialis]|uniref:Inositol oxygenase n=2 Tax=Polarella glacialis TaxID=89957 RepID=A0A813E6K8_POLGL|nr:unnamed protein product [Polarella glacialis]